MDDNLIGHMGGFTIFSSTLQTLKNLQDGIARNPDTTLWNVDSNKPQPILIPTVTLDHGFLEVAAMPDTIVPAAAEERIKGRTEIESFTDAIWEAVSTFITK